MSTLPENTHPYWRRLYEHSAAKDGAWEDHPWEDHTVFKIGEKIFVFLPTPDQPSLTVKAHPEELEALLGMPNVKRAAYIGRYGWVNLVVGSDTDLELAQELVDTSYTLIGKKAGKRRPK